MLLKTRNAFRLGYCLLRNNLYSTRKAVAPVSTEGIVISDSCVQKLKQLCDGDNNFLRVCVESGGCSGFQYKFDLDSKLENDDKFVCLVLCFNSIRDEKLMMCDDGER